MSIILLYRLAFAACKAILFIHFSIIFYLAFGVRPLLFCLPVVFLAAGFIALFDQTSEFGFFEVFCNDFSIVNPSTFNDRVEYNVLANVHRGFGHSIFFLIDANVKAISKCLCPDTSALIHEI